MGGRMGRTVVALLGAGAVLVVIGWFDTDVVRAVQRTQATTFDMTQSAIALPVGYLAIAGGILLIGLFARWADSRLVDVVYALGGAVLAFLFTLVWTVAVSVNGAPAVLPDPLPSWVGNLWTTAENGPLDAVAIVGAGMFLIGVSSLILALRARRPSAATSVSAVEPRG